MPVSDLNFANDELNSLRLNLELSVVHFARIFALNTSETALGMVAAFRQTEAPLLPCVVWWTGETLDSSDCCWL